MINLKLNSHFETELKLHVPHACCASFEKALKRGAVQTIHLRAIYFDTPQRHLARQKVALRLRLENEQWVQAKVFQPAPQKQINNSIFSERILHDRL